MNAMNPTKRTGPMLAAVLFASALPVAAQEVPQIDFEPRGFRTASGEYQREVGKLSVPENRTAATSRRIALAVVRLLSTADEPGAPLLVLPGGPGDSATALAQSAVWASYLALGDVILMDPRGVGRSEPDLAWRSDAIHPERFFGDRATAVKHAVDLCKAAADRYRSQGIDLAGYNPNEMVADLEDLRLALGAEQVNLLGHSFGTCIGLAYLKRHPKSAARFVSVGTAAPGDCMKPASDVDASLRRLSKLVAADPAAGMPDLYASVVRVVRDLEKKPLAVPITDPETGARRDLLLGAFGVQMILLRDLGDSDDLPAIPRLVATLERRDPSVASWFVAKRVSQLAALPVLTLAVRGSAGATKERWDRIRADAAKSPFGLARCFVSPESDAALGVSDAGDAFRAPVTSDVPTLFVSGTLDANTPPEQTEAIRKGLANSGHLIVEHGGHEDLLPDPKVQAAILAFLGGAPPKDARLERPPLRFAPASGPVSGFDHPALAEDG